MIGKKVLFVKRLPTRKVWPGLWDLPGGTLEPSETVEQALEREVAEEVGVRVRRFEYLDTVREREPVSGADYTNVMFRVTAWEGSPYNAAPFEHEKLGWFSIREALDLPIVESVRQALTKVLSLSK
jgi:8-oxo-dGTP pyrophosphatase MutT (NUDIX family)